MKGKIEKIVKNLNFIVVMITIIFVLIGSILLTYRVINTLQYSYYLIGIGAFSVFLYIINKICNFKFSKLEITIIILAIFALLSLIGAIDYNTALWGRPNRREGLFVILSYYAIALITANVNNKKQTKIIIGSVLTVGFCNIIYGLMQTGWIEQSFLKIQSKWYYARGFNGNSMFYGSLLSICYPIVLGLFIKEKNIKKTIIYGIMLIVYTFGTLLSGSMAVFLAEIIVFAYAFINCLIQIIKKIKNKIKEFETDIVKLIFSIGVFIVFTAIVGSKAKALSKDISEMYNQAVKITTQKKAEDSFGTGRIYIWRNTIPKIKEHFWFGVGIDNYLNAFDKPLIDKKSNGYVEKAHNEYLQIMLCEGVITGIVYIGFIMGVGVKNIKTKDNIYYALLLGFACYSIQAFFGISITRVSPIYFIVIGLLIGNKKTKQTNGT